MRTGTGEGEVAAMTVEERVEKLERELAGAKRRSMALVAGLCVLGVVWLGGRSMDTAQAQAGVAELVRAQKFELVDERGKVCAELGLMEGKPMLGLRDDKGELRAALAVGEVGPWLSLFDEKGGSRAALALSEGWPMLSLRDEKGERRVWLGLIRLGPGLSLFDEDGELIWGAP